MKTFSVSQFKALCLGLLEKVSKTGQPILITKKGKPLAQVIPPPIDRKGKDWMGSMSDTAEIEGDIVNLDSTSSKWEVLKK